MLKPGTSACADPEIRREPMALKILVPRAAGRR
jgi:hypothetical protein